MGKKTPFNAGYATLTSGAKKRVKRRDFGERGQLDYTEGNWATVQWQFNGDTCVIERFSSKEAAMGAARRMDCTIAVDLDKVRGGSDDAKYFPV